MNLENFNVKVVKKNQNNDLRLNSVHFQCHYSVELAKENTSYAISQSSVSSDKLYKLHKFLKASRGCYNNGHTFSTCSACAGFICVSVKYLTPPFVFCQMQAS